MKRSKTLALLWALVVTALLAHGGYLWLSNRIAPDTDILALLPAQQRDPVLQQAFTHMVDSAQQRVIVLVGAADWGQARRAADAYRAVLAPHGALLQFADNITDQTQRDWLALFEKHRTTMMTSQDEAALRSQPGQQWAVAALTRLYSPFSGPKLGPWQDDPFGLFGNWIQARAQETPVRPRDGRLFIGNGERQYVVMPMTLRVPALSMDAQQTITPLLAKARQSALAAVPGAEVLAAGVVLHAAAASEQASREVSMIGIGSLTGIVLLMWFTFRSLRPIGLILLSIGVGCLGALSVCYLLFDRVHLLTLVFGATLIGVAQDYGIYFLCNRLGAAAHLDSSQLLRRLLPGLLLTLVAAAIGYTGLALTPFPGLRQMTVFSVVGLVFAWLTVVFWFPVLGPQKLQGLRLGGPFRASVTRWPVLRANRQGVLAVSLLIALVAFGCARLGFNDDIRLLQNPPKDLLNEQIKLGKLLDAPTPVQFYLVRGDNADLVLQREEALKQRLDPLIDKRVITGYQAMSNWVPSALTQSTRRKMVDEKLLADGAALTVLAAQIGEDAAWVSAMRARAGNNTAPLAIDDFLKTPASEPWRHLWLGQTTGVYASIVAVRGLSMTNLPALQQAAAGLDGVQWVDKVAEISSVLGSYRQHMGWVVLFSYLTIYALLFVRYRAAAWRALAPTAVASMLVLALLGIAGQPLQLFHVLALMLLLGIGVDYGIFLQEQHDHREPTAWLAVSLSAVSALLSFGLLALSRTPALQAFGMTMLIGTTLVWLLVPCFRRVPITQSEALWVEKTCN
ncbi:MAG: exporter [Burkholderia sp.]|nr:exporter [Burkholderia sp.]